MINPPSLTREYTWIWGKDPALDAPSDKAPKKARDEWAERLRVARETCQYEGLIKPGQTPTRFTVRHIPGSQWRALVDGFQGGRFGGAIAAALTVRLGLRSISNLSTEDGDVKVTHGEIESGLGEGAKQDVIDLLDRFSPDIVTDLANYLTERQVAPGPK